MNVKKIVTVIGYIADKLGSVDKLKLVKLLYYIDKNHLMEFGRFVTNDTYVKMPYGPVPTKILDIINDPENNLFKTDKDYFLTHLTVLRDKNRTIKCKRDPDLAELSKSEINVINMILEKYGKYKGGKLINLTHDEKAWKKANNNDNLVIEDIIDDLPKQKKQELIEFLKENIETNQALYTLQA